MMRSLEEGSKTSRCPYGEPVSLASAPRSVREIFCGWAPPPRGLAILLLRSEPSGHVPYNCLILRLDLVALASGDSGDPMFWPAFLSVVSIISRILQLRCGQSTHLYIDGTERTQDVQLDGVISSDGSVFLLSNHQCINGATTLQFKQYLVRSKRNSSPSYKRYRG